MRMLRFVPFVVAAMAARTGLSFTTNPYLQNVDTDGIVVMWELHKRSHTC